MSPVRWRSRGPEGVTADSIGHRVRLRWGAATGRVTAFAWDTYLCTVEWDGGGASTVHRMYLEPIRDA